MMRQNSSNNLLIFVTNSPINSNFLHAPPPCKSLLPSWHFLTSLVRLNAFVCHLDVENMDHPRPVSPHNLFKQACDCARLHIRKGGGVLLQNFILLEMLHQMHSLSISNANEKKNNARTAACNSDVSLTVTTGSEFLHLSP